mgnify:CR=1 FL=1
MIDPRAYIIGERLRQVRRVIVVASGKGGVGKTLFSSTLALSLRGAGLRAGLLDLDLNGPACHLVLGVKGAHPVEDKGILPVDVGGVKFLSIHFFVGDRPVPLRGSDKTRAILEILAITRWPPLDFLVVDMPPGTDDEVLDVMKLMRGREFVILVTPSILAMEAVSRLASLLKEEEMRILGLVGNMVAGERDAGRVKLFSSKLGLRLLGLIGFDEGVEERIGNLRELERTKFYRDVCRVVSEIINVPPAP